MMVRLLKGSTANSAQAVLVDAEVEDAQAHLVRFAKGWRRGVDSRAARFGWW
jgi:hypothetical protein